MVCQKLCENMSRVSGWGSLEVFAVSIGFWIRLKPSAISWEHFFIADVWTGPTVKAESSEVGCGYFEGQGIHW